MKAFASRAGWAVLALLGAILNLRLVGGGLAITVGVQKLLG